VRVSAAFESVGHVHRVMAITDDDINYLVYRYLQESGMCRILILMDPCAVV